jgi:alkylation response protein AidB-like acyl-CoA dehydrogenase
VRFAFTNQQLELRDAVRQVLDDRCTPADVRAAYDDPDPHTARWATLAELGVVGMTAPPAHGGLGMTAVDLVLVLEEAGRSALPEPLAATAALAVPVLAGVGGAAADRWLPAIVDGSAVPAVGRAEPGPPVLVRGADGADLLVLVGEEGGVHVLGAHEVDVTPVPCLDPTRRLARVSWSPGDGAAGPAGEAARLLGATAAAATAAELVGLAERLVADTAAYAKERHQFGKPIGSFQAVKHLLAGALVQLEFARPLVYASAWALTENRAEAHLAASAAKSAAADAATEAARVAIQVHGAIGYTWECDVQLFAKRVWSLVPAWGDAAEHRAALLAALVARRTGDASDGRRERDRG